jgi:hypothetical protein
MSATFESLPRSFAAISSEIRLASRGTPLTVSDVNEYRKWRPTK